MWRLYHQLSTLGKHPFCSALNPEKMKSFDRGMVGRSFLLNVAPKGLFEASSHDGKAVLRNRLALSTSLPPALHPDHRFKVPRLAPL